MARTAPVPNIPPIPGMCPSVLVAAGGGDSGGAGGQGAGSGGGGGPGSGGGAADGTGGDGKAAPDPNKYPLCGTKSHPVDVVTGRAFTHPIVDFETAGPLPLVFHRSASSTLFRRDLGFGPSWGHTLGWQIEVRRASIWVFTDKGTKIAFPLVAQGDEVLGPFGWRLRRDQLGYEVDADDGLFRRFPPESSVGRSALTEIRDRNHNRIVLAYDEKGFLQRVVDSAGRTLRVRCDEGGHILSFHVERRPGEWVQLAEYGYDDRGRLVRAADGDGHLHRYEYNDRGQLTLDQNRAGLRFHFRFDEQGRCTESWGDYGDVPDPSLVDGLPTFLHDGATRCRGIHHCLFIWGADGHSVVVDSTQSSNFFGNEFGLIDKWVEGGAVTSAIYRADGHLTSLTDPEGATTEWERDARGRVLRIRDPLKRVVSMTRDGAGYPVELRDPEGGRTLLTRDSRSNVITVVNAGEGITQLTRNEQGLVTKVVDPVGGTTTVEYDAALNHVATVQNDGTSWRYTYDFLGRMLSKTDPLGAKTTYSYSVRGDLLTETDALGQTTSYQYDGEAHLVSITSPRGLVTRFTWGGYERLTSRVDANGNTVRLGFNVEGELTGIWNERGELHRFEYSPVGMMTDEHTFDGRHLRYGYDKAGRLISSRGADRKETLLEYDLAGQLVQRIGHDDSVDSFEYNLRGELVRAKGSNGVEVTFERDRLGQITAERQVVGGVAHDVKVFLDPNGERIGRQTSLGHLEEVVRDRMGRRRRTILDGQIVDHLPDALGQELRRTLPGGGTLESAFDPLGRLSQRRSVTAVANVVVGAGKPDWVGSHPTGVTASRAFKYDADGELVESHDPSRGTTEYRYDPVGQLLAMVPPKARAELFHYDPSGNVHDAAAGAASRTYGPGNRLLREGNTRYVWDADARLSEKRTYAPDALDGDAPTATWTYSWNAAGLMSRAESSDGVVVDFTYDAFARRLEKRVGRRVSRAQVEPERRVRFVWDGDLLVHEIRESALARPVEQRTYWFQDDSFEPLAHRERRFDDAGRESGGWFHYLNDSIGVPEALIDERGDVAAEYHRGAFGDLHALGSAVADTPLRLQGQYWDEETSLAYNRWRYYDRGVFVSADPIGVAGGLNVFRFGPSTFAWMDLFGLSVADVLAANMKKDHHPLKPGQTAHHIVPREDGGKEGDRARKVLDSVGVDIDHGANGARLWGTQDSQVDQPGHPGRGCSGARPPGYHGGNVHTDETYKRVADQLESAKARGGRSKKKQAKEVKSQLRRIARQMEQGTW